MSQNYFKSGDWNVICDICGFKFKATEVSKRWDGFMACKEDWEPRHIADFIRAPKPVTPLPFTRPEGADVFVGPTYISTAVGTQDTRVPTAPTGNGSTT